MTLLPWMDGTDAGEMLQDRRDVITGGVGGGLGVRLRAADLYFDSLSLVRVFIKPQH